MRRLIRGRALYTEEDRVWIAQGMTFFAVDYNGKIVTPKYHVGGIKQRFLGVNRLSRQLLRQGIHHLLPLPNGNVFLTSKRFLMLLIQKAKLLIHFQGILAINLHTKVFALLRMELFFSASIP